MTSNELNIRLIRDDKKLRVWQHEGNTKRLVLCFSGVGPTDGTLPSYDFAASATEGGKNHVLYIADPNRSWLNESGLIEDIVTVAQTYVTTHGISEICTLGHSMGGFSALIMPYFLQKVCPVKAVTALSPQYSIHPEIAGTDQRWMNFREKIGAFPIRDVGQYLISSPGYFVFHGIWRDTLQRELFPFRDNLVHTIMPKTHHNVPQRLKQKKLLDPVISACFNLRKRRVRQLLAPYRAYYRPALILTT